MDKRLTFNEVPELYDRWRPRYCRALFDAIIDHAQLGEGKTAMEIGCGTGQATGPILETGCQVTALDIGENTCAFIGEKYAQEPNLQVICADFTTFDWPDESLDLIYSATAFHWIPDDVGYPKAHRLLKPGGTLALFWNKPCPDDLDKPVHQAVQAVFDKYREQRGDNESPQFTSSRYEKTLNAMKIYGFSDAKCTLYDGFRHFDSDSYVELLNTYSENIALSPAVRRAFFDDISKAIADNGNDLIIHDRMDLYLARKP